MSFPTQLAEIGGYKMKIPPENLLGVFRNRGDSYKERRYSFIIS